MNRSRLDALASPLLIGLVAVLLVNDWVLKPAFRNAVTGKLSDVAGVAAFALFWAALFPRRRLHVFVGTALGFAAWKSPASQPLIDGWNAIGWGTIGRVVDWTDLLALAVLPVVYRIDPGPLAVPRLRRAMGPAVAAGCLLAFGATSQYRAFSYPLDARYAFDVPPDSLLQRMYDLRAGFIPWSIPPGHVAGDGLDTLRLVVGVPYEAGHWPVTVQVELARTAEGGSVLRPREASAVNADFEPADALRGMEEQVIEPLRRGRPNRVHEADAVGSRLSIAPRIRGPGELFLPRDTVRVWTREAAFLALIEITPRLDWHVIYPVTEDDERLRPPGERVLVTRCARTPPGPPVPPGAEVPPCALAQRMTLADARRLHETEVPHPCPAPYNRHIDAVRPGTLFLIAADAPMPRAILEETLGTWCAAHPTLAGVELEKVLGRMRVRHYAVIEHPLRR